MTDSWKELNRALKKKFGKKNYTPKIRGHFFKAEKGVISFCTEDIDNLYDKENDSRWEIYLKKDGTWQIV